MNVVSTFRHLLVGRLRWLLATGDERDAEILALRHQILVLQRQINRPRFTDTDRTILAVLSTAFERSRLHQVMLIVQPKTVIGWHRRLVARHWTYPPTTRRGRPPTLAEIRQLAIRLATENPTWGYRRVHGELCRIGHRIAASTVWTILRTAGIDPTPGRTGPKWAQFIRSQAKGIIATDFACVDTATLRRFHVLFFIEISSRRVHLGGITTNPTGRWTTQAARNFSMDLDRQFRFVIHDGAGQYAPSFDAVFEAGGITAITTPPRAPMANTYAERWVRTLRHELLDRTIIWNERQLRALIVDYIDHYNQHRPHRSLDQAAPDRANVLTIGTDKAIVRRARCGGLINEYHHAA
jgi:putative transposase